MSLLAGTAYDPATAVSKATTAALAMTAVDTVNLRLSFQAPTNGRVLVRMNTVVYVGAAGVTPWMPLILLGVLDGSTVRGRMTPNYYASGATPAVSAYAAGVEALFTVSGLTSGTTYNFDAAYGVESAVAGTSIQYGGPNNATVHDAWGAFVYEIWDTA